MADQISPLAGKTVDPSMLVNVPRLVTAYFTGKPDPAVASQRVAFGTSGHRGVRLRQRLQRGAHPGDQPGDLSPPEAGAGITGPLFIGIDTHALSEPGPGKRARGVCRQRRRCDDRRARRLHADARRFARDPDLQHKVARAASPTGSSSPPRIIRPRTAASSTIPPNGGPGRYRRNNVDRARRKRTSRRTTSMGCGESHMTARANRLRAPPRLHRLLCR